jgi:alpha-galactosidase
MGYDPFNHFGNGVDQWTIGQIAAAMAAGGMRAAGYRYVVVDDSWQGGRAADGTLVPNAAFSCGIARLAAYVHSRGLLFGLYTSPAAVSCGGHPGSAGHETQDAATFARWGVDYLKLDWCGADTSPAGAAAIARRWRAALDATGRPVVLSVNAGPGRSVAGWASRTVSSWRTGLDVCASWYNQTRAPAKAATSCVDPVNYLGIYDYLTSDIRWDLGYVRPGHWADPDMLEVGNAGLDPDEARTQLAMWAMWAAPLVAGNDPRTMRPGDPASATLLNPEIIAVDQDPLGQPAHLVSSRAGLQVWARPLAGGAATTTEAVAVVNLTDAGVCPTLTWHDLGITDVTSARDLWAHASLPAAPTGVPLTIPAHGTAVLRLTSQPSA